MISSFLGFISLIAAYVLIGYGIFSIFKSTRQQRFSVEHGVQMATMGVAVVVLTLISKILI